MLLLGDESTVSYLSEGEDRERACRLDPVKGNVEVETELGFRFVVDRLVLRRAQRGACIEEFADALEAAYEKSVRDWLRNGPWL